MWSAFLVKTVEATHYPSVSGIYYLRKNVDVELLVLVRVIHTTKQLLLHEWERDHNDVKAYTRLSRYIRMLSGTQVLLHQAIQNKTVCHCCHTAIAR